MKKVTSTIAFLRLEGLVIFILALTAFNKFNINWWIAVGILLPDISMIGYLVDNKTGAFVYNLGHALVLPLLLVMLGVWQESPEVLGAGLIWAAHIGMDRAFGFGLKEEAGFNHTHLGVIGRRH